MEFISTFDDPGDGLKKLNKISKTVETDDCTYRGFNLFNEDDSKIFEIITRGEFNIKGIQNISIREYLPDKSPASISRIIKRLHVGNLQILFRKLGKKV